MRTKGNFSFAGELPQLALSRKSTPKYSEQIEALNKIMLLILFLLIISKIICQFLLGIISILLQELAFPLRYSYRLANPFVPLLCRLISITAHTSTLLIPGGWVQTWGKSLHIPRDQQSDIGLHWATTWPIRSGVFG